jgi:hypothetical protein
VLRGGNRPSGDNKDISQTTNDLSSTSDRRERHLGLHAALRTESKLERLLLHVMLLR